MQCLARNLALAAICLSVISLSGCADFADTVMETATKPWSKKSQEVAGIKSPDDRIKDLRALAQKAKKMKPEEQQQIVNDLAKSIQHENEALVRRQMLRTLAVFPQPQAAAVIAAGLSESDVESRRTACACLGIRGGKESVQELARVMSSDTSFDVRVAAVRALGATGDTAAMPPLAEAMADADPALQSRARDALASISGRDYGDNLEAWREYAKTGQTSAKEISLAERMKRAMF